MVPFSRARERAREKAREKARENEGPERAMGALGLQLRDYRLTTAEIL